ncbi:MAG: SDR family NAD(P)-dependent oxidoreductase, partial [Thermocrispum sp.]
MVFGDKAVVITGAGGGIGAALALRFAREHPRVVVAADINAVRAEQTARQVRALGVPALAVAADVSDQEQVRKLIAEVQDGYGQVDIVCSNAGVAAGMGVHAPDGRWASSWGVNVMAHVYLA